MSEYLKTIKSIFVPKRLSISELNYLNELLKSNLPFKTCISLICDNRNKKIINNLIFRLDKGELVERIIGEYLPKEISKYMENLLGPMTFSKTLDLSLSFLKKSKTNSEEITKNIAYPIILLFVSLSALYLFDSFGLDSIVNLLSSFRVDTKSILVFRIALRIIINVFYIGFLIVICLIMYFKSPKRISMFYILASKRIPNSFMKMYFSQEFISLYIIASEMGYTTKDVITILKSLKNKPIVSLLAFHLEEQLLKGDAFKDAVSVEYFDPLLEKFVNIAVYSNNFTGILENYIEYTRMKIENKTKLITFLIQSGSYIMIGFVVIFIYQILFLPMSALSSY